jgi:hypothetical protein
VKQTVFQNQTKTFFIVAIFVIIDSQSFVLYFGVFFNDLSLGVFSLIQRILLETLKLKWVYVASLQNFAVNTNYSLVNVIKLEAK